MPSILRRVVVSILLEDLDPFGPAMDVLRTVEAEPNHSMRLDAMSDEEREAAERLVARGLLRRVPAGHAVTTDARGKNARATPVAGGSIRRYPDRYAVTSAGSYALGTFASDV